MEYKVNALVEHPAIDFESRENLQPVAVMLTKKERKKMRRQRRAAEQEEKRQQVILGLVPPPEPKLKLSNLIRTKGKDAIENPTQIEEEVRKQMQERLLQHQMKNQMSKLTPMERRAKKEAKIQRDKEKETLVAVFRVLDLSNGRHKFKVETNALQNQLTGVCVRYGKTNVVIVEGGPKAVSFYKKLMLRRIDWNEREQDDHTVTIEGKVPNECHLVWEGSVAKPAFTNFTVHDLQTETKVKKLLDEKGVSHYFELAKQFKPETSQQIVF